MASMSSPPNELISPTFSTSSASNQPFIYPIRSAVSVKQPSITPSASQSSHVDSRDKSTFLPPTDTHHHQLSRVESPATNPTPTSDSGSENGLATLPTSDSHESLNSAERLESVVTRRFKHVETPEGHMILTGKEDKLTRCEDEPIHTPGAVQSFGCMVVVKVLDSGEVVVRQVSENSTQILGIPPAYLFSLASFLDLFDQDQADLLWENIDMLDQTDSDLVESGPSVFQLKGYSMSYNDKRVEAGQDRPIWIAWCAAHLPELRQDGQEETTVILEFELVNDHINPISFSPPPPTPSVDQASNGVTSTAADSPPASISTVDSDGNVSEALHHPTTRLGSDGVAYQPSLEAVKESTQSVHKPIKALQKMRRNNDHSAGRPRPPRPHNRPKKGTGDGAGGMLDMFGILSQVNEQLLAQSDLKSFLKVMVGIIRDISLFSRVMIYQFDELWNGQIVCELVDWNDTHDLYHGLHFPATDIPAQARALYKLNKVRLLYDRQQPTARMVCRDKSDLDHPLDMSHSFLRAMSLIHLKYLENMAVRSAMSISIVAFGELWGLISLHNYANHGRRVSFPIRQLLRLIGDSVSRNIERLSYTQRLSARKLINTVPTDRNPSGYIISNAEDLLNLFNADFGVIAIGSEAKILGPLSASQEVLAFTEYLRLKKFEHLVTSQDVCKDFPDMVIPTGLQVIAGLLLIPLSSSGVDFIAFLRKAQVRHVNWAGKPQKQSKQSKTALEPRKSFKVWSETVEGTCRGWKDEELETASVLCLVYGKFISVWRQREQALHYNQLNQLLLSNASHEVRTPLNHIINYLELALESKLDEDTRENLSKSHMASKSLLFVINDLLDLTKQEQGNTLFLQEPLDLAATVREAVEMHEWEAKRHNIDFTLVTDPPVCMVLGDKNRLRQVVANTVTNSLKYTGAGHIYVLMRKCPEYEQSPTIPKGYDMEVELTVSDSGEGIPQEKLEVIFRQFEQVESVITEPGRAEGPDCRPATTTKTGNASDSGLGLGLAIVARIVKNLGGHLCVDSAVGQGSTFTYYIPFRSATYRDGNAKQSNDSLSMKRSKSFESASVSSAAKSEIDSLVEAIQKPVFKDQNLIADVVHPHKSRQNSGSATGAKSASTASRPLLFNRSESFDGAYAVEGSNFPVRSVKIEPMSLDTADKQVGRRVFTRRTTEAEMYKEHIQNRDKLETGGRGSHPRTQSAERSHQNPTDTKRRSKDDATITLAAISRPSCDTEPPCQALTSKPTLLRQLSNLSIKKKPVTVGNLKKPVGTGKKKKPLSPFRVLVVEDDPINRMILKKRLGMDGHTVLLAVNGEEGVRQFEKDSKEIDVILMDLQMPICNGQDACKRIRQFEAQRQRTGENANRPAAHVLNGRVPIIAVSATLTSQMRPDMADIGMDGWLLKPIDFAHLGALLKGLLHATDREANRWKPGFVWEKGGWLSEPARRTIRAGDTPV